MARLILRFFKSLAIPEECSSRDDVATMPGHFEKFVAQQESPGLLLIPSRNSIGTVIEGLLEVWLTWSPEELRNQVRWVP
jgi:hypothetical protein